MTTDKSPLHEADGLCYQAVMLVGPPRCWQGDTGENAGTNSGYLPCFKRGYVPRT